MLIKKKHIKILMREKMLNTKEKKLIIALRKQDTQTIMDVSKSHEIPKSTLYDIMHRLQKTEVIKQVTKISFDKIGFPIKIFFIIRTDTQSKERLKQFLISNKNVNNIHMINNSTSFHIECIFRNQKSAEEFLELLEQQVPLIQLSAYNLLETLQEERFLTREEHFE